MNRKKILCVLNAPKIAPFVPVKLIVHNALTSYQGMQYHYLLDNAPRHAVMVVAIAMMTNNTIQIQIQKITYYKQ